MSVHPAAQVFPLLEGAEFEGLVRDIEANGQVEAVVVWEGQLLDGRNRMRACERLQIPPLVREHFGDERSAVDLIVSLNLRRRHLNATQRAAMALALKPYYEQIAAKAKAETQGRPPQGKPPRESGEAPQDRHEREAAAQAARATGANRRYVAELEKVRGTDPDLYKLAEAGKLNASEAVTLARLPEPARKDAVEAATSAPLPKRKRVDEIAKRAPSVAAALPQVSELDEARAKLRATRRRWGHLVELNSVWAAIDEAIK